MGEDCRMWMWRFVLIFCIEVLKCTAGFSTTAKPIISSFHCQLFSQAVEVIPAPDIAVALFIFVLSAWFHFTCLMSRLSVPFAPLVFGRH